MASAKRLPCSECFHVGVDIFSNDLELILGVPSSCKCMEHCFQTEGCAGFTFIFRNDVVPLDVPAGSCFLETNFWPDAVQSNPDVVSATAECCE